MKGKMKAQVFYKAKDMRLEEVDIPQISDNEILIKVKVCSICGSDLEYYYGNSPLGTPDGKGPLILGHEFSGVVEEVGAIPKSMGICEVGDRVIGNPVGPCFACEMCQRGYTNLCSNVSTNGVNTNGAFAEYTKVPYTNIVKMPKDMTFEQAAFTEPTACATYAIKQLEIGFGDTVLIYGCGPIGLIMTQIAKAQGAGKVIVVGRRDYPLGIAKDVGADEVINIKDTSSAWYASDVPAKVKELNDGKLANRAIVATANIEAGQSALLSTGPRATIVMFGLAGSDEVLEVPLLDSIVNDKILKFSWLSPLVWPETVAAIGAGKIDFSKLCTNRYALENLSEGIEFMKEGKGNKIKGVCVVDQ